MWLQQRWRSCIGISSEEVVPAAAADSVAIVCANGVFPPLQNEPRKSYTYTYTFKSNVNSAGAQTTGY